MEVDMRALLTSISACDMVECETAFNALKARQRTLRSIEADVAISSLPVGTVVRLKGLSPKYLNGSIGTITKLDRGKFVVEIDPERTHDPRVVGRMRNARVPAQCVETI